MVGDWKAERGRLFGEVVINSQPAKRVIVTLHPQGEAVDVRKSRPWGLTNEGVYAADISESGDGAQWGVPGDDCVEVRSVEAGGDGPAGVAYSKPEKSEWEVSVGEGENLLPKIELVT